MREAVLWILAALYLGTGLYLVVAPAGFYQNAPGVSATGPYNMHFIIDVGLAFGVSALALAWGVWAKSKPVIVFGAAWIALHGLFHLVLWLTRGDRLGEAALTDLGVVVLPALVTAALAVKYKEREHA